ncbi:MAG: DUF2214 family protein [Acidobacteriota bacterium]
MWTPAVFSALHVLALAIGFSSVLARGRRLRDLRRSPADPVALAGVLRADSFWGLAALLWIVTGLTRAFGHIEKTSDFYLHNGFFWVKMALFGTVLLLETIPMTTLIRWRIEKPRGGARIANANLAMLIALNDAQTVLVLVIPFVAAMMARGAWLL